MHTSPKIFKRWRNQFTVSHNSRYADEMDVLNVAIAQIIKYLPILCSFRLCIHSNEFQLRLGSVTLSICMLRLLLLCVSVCVFFMRFHFTEFIEYRNCKIARITNTHHPQYIRYDRSDRSFCLLLWSYSITFQRCFFNRATMCVYLRIWPYHPDDMRIRFTVTTKWYVRQRRANHEEAQYSTKICSHTIIRSFVWAYVCDRQPICCAHTRSMMLMMYMHSS